MGTFKKISCIIAVIFLIFASVIPSFADETTSAVTTSEPSSSTFPLAFGSPYYVFSGYLTSGDNPQWVYDGGFFTLPSDASAVSSSLPYTGWLRSTYDGGTSASKYNYLYGYCASIVDENGILDYIRNDYSYSVVFTVRFTFGIPSGDKISLAPSNDADLFLTNNHPTYTGTYQQTNSFNPNGILAIDSGLFDDFNLTVNAVEVPGSSTSKFYDVTYGFVFHVPSADDLVLPVDLNFLSLIVYFNIDSTLVPNLSKLTPVYTQWQSITGLYDPTGSNIDDLQNGVDQIIAGQIEAAQYALDQEQAANEAALQDALDGSDTDGMQLSNKFGASLLNLYNALTYGGTSFSLYLPASGTIPFLNKELWSQTEIPIKEYIDKIPSAVWFVVNFILWFMVIRAIIKLVHRIIDWVSGSSGGGD